MSGAERTPGPWRASGQGTYVLSDAIHRKVCQLVGLYIDSPNAEADARFIVRACNAHEDLVEALVEVANASEDDALIGNDFRKFARNTARDALRKLETPDHIDPESLRL